MKRVLPVILAFSGIGTAAVQSQYLPPPGALREVYESNIKYLRGSWNRVLYDVVTEPKLTDIDDATLLGLVYEPNEVPGMVASPPLVDDPTQPDRHHTTIVVTNRYGRIQRVYCTTASLEAVTDAQGKPHRRFRDSMLIEIYAYNSSEEAHSAASEWSGGSYQRLGKLVSGSRLGEVHWTRLLSHGRYDVVFVAGRVVTRLEWHRRGEAASPEKTQAMAWGVLYRLLHQPKLVSGRLPTAQRDGTAELNGVKVAPIKQLESSGVRIENQQTEGSWKVQVTWGQRWVELAAFSWEMKTWDGKVVKLSRPVFPYRGELIAPLQEVKQALGMP
jgi:hypothetical protein